MANRRAPPPYENDEHSKIFFYEAKKLCSIYYTEDNVVLFVFFKYAQYWGQIIKKTTAALSLPPFFKASITFLKSVKLLLKKRIPIFKKKIGPIFTSYPSPKLKKK